MFGVHIQAVTRSSLAPDNSAIVTMRLTPQQRVTFLANGTATVSAGTYGVHVGGHQPDDVLGEAESNVVSGSFLVVGRGGEAAGVTG